jgi:hypothetical protein
MIVERVEQGRRLFILRKYTKKTLFLGKLPVLSLLLVGFWGCTFYFSNRFNSRIETEMQSILSQARVDEMKYQVIDFFEQKGKFIIQVGSRLTPTIQEKDISK